VSSAPPLSATPTLPGAPQLGAHPPRGLRWPRLLRLWSGRIGVALLVLVLLVAIFGPLFAPHSPNAPVGAPGARPGARALLGTDTLGRDVLSRVLNGGLTVLLLSGGATVLAYLVGLAVGITAGYTRSLIDPLLMRFVDLILSLPAMLLLLVLITGVGSGDWVLILGVVLVQFPGISRLARTATLEASVRGYVEAAVARGDRGAAVAVREILPNILPVIIADFGVRFAGSIVFVASLNFLGLGLRPPTSDWGLMISENRELISVNAWSVAAPCIMLGLLTISVNLIGDAYSRSMDRAR
jgi:peptide/nickel transport system permease protein